MKTSSLDRHASTHAASPHETASPAARRPGAKLKTGVKAGTSPMRPIVWTYTNGGVTHEDTWNAQT